MAERSISWTGRADATGLKAECAGTCVARIVSPWDMCGRQQAHHGLCTNLPATSHDLAEPCFATRGSLELANLLHLGALVKAAHECATRIALCPSHLHSPVSQVWLFNPTRRRVEACNVVVTLRQ